MKTGPHLRQLALAATIALSLAAWFCPRPAQAEAAARLFLRECAGCHGPGGEGGRGPTLALPRLARAPDRKSLLKVIEKGIEGTEMPAARLAPAQIQLLASWVRKLGQRPPEKVPGDAKRGASLYFGRGGCPMCHAIGGHGGALGPDLTDIGRRRGATHLRTSLTDPEAALPTSTSPYRSDVSIAQNFLQVRLVSKAGQEIVGVRVNEDTFSIQIRDVTNQLHSFWKDQLVSLDKDWGKSPMPSYQETLAKAELDDLVAFLLSLRGEENR